MGKSSEYRPSDRTSRGEPNIHGSAARWEIAAFLRNAEGMAAVEFGLIGSTFVLLFCFWLELGVTLFMQTALDNATRDAARQLRIGAVTTSSAFASALCTDLAIVMPCSGLKYNVVSGTSFSSLSTHVTTDSNNQMTGTQFTPGSTGSDVVVQVSYTRKISLPIVNSVLGSNGTILLVSTLAFQNEPY